MNKSTLNELKSLLEYSEHSPGTMVLVPRATLGTLIEQYEDKEKAIKTLVDTVITNKEVIVQLPSMPESEVINQLHSIIVNLQQEVRHLRDVRTDFMLRRGI